MKARSLFYTLTLAIIVILVAFVFASRVLAFSNVPSAHNMPLAISTPTINLFPATVEQNSLISTTITVVGSSVITPFTQVMVTASFTPPVGSPFTLLGFADSYTGDLFRLRFTPEQVGTYTYTIYYTDPTTTANRSGTLTSRGGSGDLALSRISIAVLATATVFVADMAKLS